MKPGTAVLIIVVALPTGCTTQAEVASTTAASPSTVDVPPLTTTTSVAPSTTITMTTTAPEGTDGDPGLAGRLIVIDPGHNGLNREHTEEIDQLVDIGTGTKPCNTVGTATNGGYSEAEFTWDVATIAVPMLESHGAEVILTRQDNEGWGPCITERAATGNEFDADAVISIHADGGPPGGRGFHVIHPERVEGFTDDIAAESLRLAETVHAAYRGTGMPVADYVGDDGLSERSDLGGLTLSDVPVVFLEAGNMRNEEDAVLLEDPGFRTRIAEAITAGLLSYLTG